MKCFHIFFMFVLTASTLLRAQNATFTDHGFIPVGAISSSVSVAEFQSGIYNNGDVFVATDDGIWKNNIGTQAWSPAGLQGISISALYQHPSLPNTFFAGARINLPLPYTNTTPVYTSTDGGVTWNPATTFVNENHYSFAVRPGYPDHIYANVEAAGIAVSIDGGHNWEFMNHATGGYFGYSSCLVFIPANANRIYQGSENPMDCAWLGKYDIGNADPVILNNFATVVNGQCGSGPWANRRPDDLHVFSNNSDNIYVGQEGALSKVDPSGLNQSEFLYISNGESDKPYSYIYGIWVDPADTNHLIFGGSLNSPIQPMQLYETYDEGTTFYRYTQTFGLTNPMVREIIDIGGNRVAVILDDLDQDRVKLIVMGPNLLSIGDDLTNENSITVSPVPATGQITIHYNLKQTGGTKITLANSLGQIASVMESNAPIEHIDVNQLADGIYWMTVEMNDRCITKKIVLY